MRPGRRSDFGTSSTVIVGSRAAQGPDTPVYRGISFATFADLLCDLCGKKLLTAKAAKKIRQERKENRSLMGKVISKLITYNA
jgi:hypothetical protein